MGKLRLNQKERAMMRDITIDTVELRFDQARRLRNALLALSLMDAGWMAWAERELPRRIPKNPERLTRLVFLVETRARGLMLKNYRFLFRGRESGFLLRDWPFSDDGALTPG